MKRLGMTDLRWRDPRTWGLMFLGIVICFSRAWGYAPWSGPPEILPPALNYLAQVMPIWIYALIWFLSGLACIWNALTPHRKVLAIAVPSFIPLLWAIVYFAAWWASSFSSRDWITAAIYWGISGAICCLGLVKPVEPKAGA